MPDELCEQLKRGFNIVIDQTHINQYPEGVSIVLSVLGHTEALVSDLSEIGDFDPSEETLSLLDAKRGDIIWEIAARIERDNDNDD